MTQGHFYILDSSEIATVNTFICRYIAKAYYRGHALLVLASCTQEAQQLDRHLWEFGDDSFIPHHLIGTGAMSNCAVQISMGSILPVHHDILLNLSTGIPEQYHQFQHIAHIIGNHESALKHAREQYRTYRKYNVPVVTHDARKGTQDDTTNP